MALGPYNSTTISETRLDNLLTSNNSPIGSGTNLNATLAEEFINLRLFNNDLFIKIPYQSDSTGVTQTQGSEHLFFETGSTGSSTMDFTTNGAKAVIVLEAAAATNFVDLGSTGDKGDVIVGYNLASQFIEVTQGNNFVVAGNGESTLMGGSGKDTLVAGGNTSIVGGSGAESIVGGAAKSAHDTLVGGTGADTMSVLKGDNLIVAGSGPDSIYSADKGSGGGFGGDSISLVGGGSANVSIGAGTATDSVYFGGTTGDDSIVAKGNTDVLIQNTEVLTKVDTMGGTTTLSFQDGQTLTYSGSGHVTVNFNGF